MKPETYATGMAMLRDTFNTSHSEPVQRIYHDLLIEFDDEVFIAAVGRIIATHTFYPKPVEITNAIKAVAAERSGIESGEQAWQRILRIARTWHPQVMVRDELGEDIYAALASVGGIRRVALAGDSGDYERERELASMKKGFITAYEPTYQQHTTERAKESVDAGESHDLSRLLAGATKALRMPDL